MKEYMLPIRNQADEKAGLSTAEHQRFLQAGEVYIEGLKKNGNLKSAQPLPREGKMISGVPGSFT